MLGMPDPKDVGYYYTLSQVGIEMVVPIGIGAGLDYYLGWSPWGAIVGAVLGLVGGFAHLIFLLNRHDNAELPKPPRDSQ